VQCLRTLLGSGEEQIETIYLAPQEERCGTYLPRPTPRVSPSPHPGPLPNGARAPRDTKPSPPRGGEGRVRGPGR